MKRAKPPLKKNIKIFNAALGGMKQPQGSFAYQALDALGYRFDIVIELSGFNEIAVAIGDNYLKRGINPIYPRNANLILFEASKRITSNKIQRSADYIFSLHPFHQFLTEMGIYGIIRREIIEPQIRKDTRYLLGQNYLMPESIEEAFDLSMQIWKKSSQNVLSLARSNNAIYILAIQPNQYFIGSKSLSNYERKLISDSEKGTFIYRLLNKKVWTSRVGSLIKLYYPRIDIDNFNIPHKNILDLRNEFINEKVTIYEDACCHMNELGMKIIANKIASRAAMLFATSK